MCVEDEEADGDEESELEADGCFCAECGAECCCVFFDKWVHGGGDLG